MSDITKKYTREVKYINKDFAEFRNNLINFAKDYFPNTYSDFNESSPGMMFIEMASYIGDVLSFYGDVQLQESFLYTVDEKLNLYNLAQSLGYKPNTVVPSSVELEVMQVVPSIGEGNSTSPDFRYALNIRENMITYTQDNVFFRTVDPVNFGYSSSFDPTDISVYSVSNTGAIQYYLLKKKVKAVSGFIKQSEYAFTDPKIYDKIVINDNNVSHIIDIVDSDGNKWYEVPHLAQDLVPISLANVETNDPLLSRYKTSVPYLLSFKQTEYRYVTRIRKDDKIEIQFGSGLSTEADEEIVPNPYNVGIGLDYFNRSVDVSMDPLNFLYTKTYGKAPSDTTLTVRYSICNGISDNVNANTINYISSREIVSPIFELDSNLYNTVVNSLVVNNPNPSFGGMNSKPIDVVRQEAISNFAAQNRVVTREDYMVRCYSMPSKYGSIAKAFVDHDFQSYSLYNPSTVPNQFALNLYVLCYDNNKNLIPANEALKQNLKTYLSQYRMLTDAINIKDAYVVNIGIDYEIIIRPNYNSNDVLLRCHEALINYLSPDKMQINQPILLNKIYSELDKIEGVQTVQRVEVSNLYDKTQGYSSNFYDIKTATRNGIVYPSVDPMIFEVKFPKKDITGRVVDL